MSAVLKFSVAFFVAMLFAVPLATTSAAATREAFGAKMTKMVGAIDCHPSSDRDYVYQGPGGVRMQSGSSYFHCGLDFPVGTKIIRVIVYIDPMGSTVPVNVGRFKVLPPVFDELASAFTTPNTGVEPVNLKLNHVVKARWTYRIHNMLITSTNAAVLYGYKVTYRLPN